MNADHSPPHPDFEDADDRLWDAASWLPVPDVVDLVVEAATMESVFAAQRLTRIDSMRRELLAEAAGRGSGVTDIVERSIRLELAAAMRVTEYAAGRMIAHAEALVRRYPDALDSLGRGDMTLKHAEILVDDVDQLPPELRERVTGRAVELAESEPVGTFRRALRALIETAQAPTMEQRHQAALQTRRVVVERGQDGMGVLLAYAPVVELHAIFGRITAIAKTITGQDGETRTLDQVRADVLCDLLVDGAPDAAPAEARGIRESVVVRSRSCRSSTMRPRRPLARPRSRASVRFRCRAPESCAAETLPGCESSPIPRPAVSFPWGASSIDPRRCFES